MSAKNLPLLQGKKLCYTHRWIDNETDFLFVKSLNISFAGLTLAIEVKFENSYELSSDCIDKIHPDATIRYSLRSYHGGYIW